MTPLNPSLPICAPPEAFKLLAEQIPALDSQDALLYGAIAISMLEPDNIVEPAVIDGTLQGYADAIRFRVRGVQPQALLAHLHDELFEIQRFTDCSIDYYNPANCYLSEVLHNKRGLPTTLAIIYKIVAERLGMPTYGVALPKHFLCGFRNNTDLTLLVDTSAEGRIVTIDEIRARVKEELGQHVEWNDAYLQPVSNRHWLTRILQNLLHTFGTQGRFYNLAAVLEMEMLLWPKRETLRRDLGLVLARCGLSHDASTWLDLYLKDNPDDPQKDKLAKLLDVLK